MPKFKFVDPSGQYTIGQEIVVDAIDTHRAWEQAEFAISGVSHAISDGCYWEEIKACSEASKEEPMNAREVKEDILRLTGVCPLCNQVKRLVSIDATLKMVRTLEAIIKEAQEALS